MKVYGSATLTIQYSVDLDTTEEEFESLSEHKQAALIEETINWSDAINGAEVSDIEFVYEE